MSKQDGYFGSYNGNDDDEDEDLGWVDDNGNFHDYADEDEGDEDGEVYLNAQRIVNNSTNLPLCEHFLATRKNAKKKSTLSWLQTLDNDTLNMILEHVKEVRDKTNTDDETVAKDNTVDIFDKPETAIENDEDYLNKEEDLYGLTSLLLAWEHDNFMIPSSILDQAVFLLAIYAVGEFGCREGKIKITGNGTLMSKNTVFTPSKKHKNDFMKAMVEFSPDPMTKKKKK